jgi:hypothetical protein
MVRLDVVSRRTHMSVVLARWVSQLLATRCCRRSAAPIAWVLFTDKSMRALWRWRTCDFASSADKCDLQQNRRPARHYRERCSDGLGVQWISAWKLCPQLSVTR